MRAPGVVRLPDVLAFVLAVVVLAVLGGRLAEVLHAVDRRVGRAFMRALATESAASLHRLHQPAADRGVEPSELRGPVDQRAGQPEQPGGTGGDLLPHQDSADYEGEFPLFRAAQLISAEDRRSDPCSSISLLPSACPGRSAQRVSVPSGAANDAERRRGGRRPRGTLPRGEEWSPVVLGCGRHLFLGEIQSSGKCRAASQGPLIVVPLRKVKRRHHDGRSWIAETTTSSVSGP